MFWLCFSILALFDPKIPEAGNHPLEVCGHMSRPAPLRMRRLSISPFLMLVS